MKNTRYEKLTAFLMENQEHFYRIAFSYVHNREQALDVVQSAVLKALEKCESLRREEAVRSWFYRIVVNESISAIRKNSREIPLEDVQMEQTGEEEQEVDYDLYQKVDRLPTEQKTVILLRFYEELSLKEIAEVTGESLSTVKSRLYGALRKLKVEIKEEIR